LEKSHSPPWSRSCWRSETKRSANTLLRIIYIFLDPKKESKIYSEAHN
jgi:hypothetical protein